MLHLHGNAGNVSSHADFSRFLTDAGMHVLIIDYRGYGRSDVAGPLRRGAVMRDARAALDYLLRREDVDASRVGVFGVSLGAAFASRLASERAEVRALVTLSAFASWRGLAGELAPVVGALIFPGGMDPIESVARIGDRPYLIVHGTRDGLIGVRHADRLKARCDEAGVDATLVRIEGAGHNDTIVSFPEAREAIALFFRRTLAVRSP